jgi:hypothetical protein
VWWIHTYQWLEENNLFKSTVAFWVTIILSAFLASVLRPWRAWKKHREAQEKIADRLDTSTPGGLADVVKALKDVIDDLDDGGAPDDNGSDPVDSDDDHKKQPHGGKTLPGRTVDAAFPIHVDPMHGGGHGR